MQEGIRSLLASPSEMYLCRLRFDSKYFSSIVNKWFHLFPTEKRSHNSNRARARQDDGGRVTRIQAAIRQCSEHLLSTERQVCVLDARGVRTLHQPETEQTRRADW